MKKASIVFIFISLLMISCQNSENEKLILGNWQGAEWLVDGNPSEYDVQQVHFSFTKDGYTSDFGGEKENGTFYLRDYDLYTTADNGIEIMVKIAKLSKDSLVFNMNRSGQAETLTLTRK